MANLLIGYGNQIDSATLDNGSFEATLPITNIQDGVIQRVARTVDCLTTSTVVDVTFPNPTHVAVIAIAGHNMSVDATVRAYGDDVDDNFASPIYDSTALDVWPSGMIPEELLEWEDDNFWLGKISEEARAAFQTPFIIILSSPQTLKYWRIQITDTTNADGYIDIGRIFMGRAWRLTYNYFYGAEQSYEDETVIETSLSGAEFFDVRLRKRTRTFPIGLATEAEVNNYADEINRRVGTSGDILIVPDSDNTEQIPRSSFIGRNLQTAVSRHDFNNRYSLDLKVRELL